jgi:ubiquinone/menaquinone biosynthesis C-methylase UbiE
MIISYGDIIDLYIQLVRKNKMSNIFTGFFKPEKLRTHTWWSRISKGLRHWWEIPAVNKRWNEKICGDPDTSYINYIADKYLSGNKPVNILSPGCGNGGKEMRIAMKFPTWKITGFDLNRNRIDAARSKAHKQNIRNVKFIPDDIENLKSIKEKYDCILFDSSLHHFRNLDYLIGKCGKLLTGQGLLIVNEYVGPNRFQWTRQQLLTANRLLLTIPEKYRYMQNVPLVKKRIYRPGTLRMILSDPSESVQSSSILPALHSHCSTLKETALGGNLLQLILKDIAHHFISPVNETREILQELFTAEDRFLKNNSSDFIFGIYRF